MKIWSSCLCLLALFAVALTTKAQNCITFSTDYAAYDNESTDGTNITVDIIMDGSGTMTINRNLPGCGSLPGQASHTPVINSYIIASPSGNQVGGSVTGAGQCADCYLWDENTQTIPIGNDTSWQDNWSAQVLCNVGGSAWGSGGMISIRLGYSYAAYNFQNATRNPNPNGSPWICNYAPVANCNVKCVAQSTHLFSETAETCPGQSSTYIPWLSWGSGPTQYMCVPLPFAVIPGTPGGASCKEQPGP